MGYMVHFKIAHSLHTCQASLELTKMALDLLMKQQEDIFFALDTETPAVSVKDSGPDLPEVEDPNSGVLTSKRHCAEQQRRDRLRHMSYERRREKALAKKAQILSRMDRRIRKIDRFVDLLTIKHRPLAVLVEAHMNVSGVEDGYLGDNEEE